MEDELKPVKNTLLRIYFIGLIFSAIVIILYDNFINKIEPNSLGYLFLGILVGSIGTYILGSIILRF